MSEAKENANHRKTGGAELALLVLGIAVLAVRGAARTESIINSHSAAGKFNAFDSPAFVLADSTKERGTSPVTKTVLCASNEKNVQPPSESFSARTDVPLAVLRIPKSRPEVPALERPDGLTLNHVAGRIARAARLGEPGNIGIAGHRDGFFRGLNDVTVGDTVELRSLTETVAYKVDRVSIVAPGDVSVLNPQAGPSLTPATATPFTSSVARHSATLSRLLRSGCPNWLCGRLPTNLVNVIWRNDEFVRDSKVSH